MLEDLEADGTIDDNQVQLVGLIQEQHPERCKLFMKWKKMDFPVLVDSLNRLGVWAVPMLWAIDAHGVVRNTTRPRKDWIRDKFLKTDYPESSAEPAREQRDTGVDAFLARDWDNAITAFEQQTKTDAKDAKAWFRLGCSLRARHDSTDRKPDDFQRAIEAWTQAVRLFPRNYIFQRRLQQYGPRLGKPYPFYDWVAQAQADLRKRGVPVEALTVPLEGSEVAAPVGRPRGAIAEPNDAKEPDPEGTIDRDKDGWVGFASVVAPKPPAIGGSVRAYLRFTPNRRKEITWDNEAGPLRVWLNVPDSIHVASSLLVAKMPEKSSSSSEVRTIELELELPDELAPGKVEVSGYALYFVCSGKRDQCVHLRQDFTIAFDVVKGRPRHRRR